MSRIRLCFIFIVFYQFHESNFAKHGMMMIPERAEITYANPKYVIDNATVSVRRSSRRGQYVVNLSGYNKHTWANNVTLSLRYYEYLHNEYRPSFVEASYKLCDFINTDPYGRFLQKYGVVCPVYKKYWVLSNVTLVFPVFPYLFPFTKSKVFVVIKKVTPLTEEIIGSGNLYVTIKQI